MPYLEINSLSLDYTSGKQITPALRDISFSLEQGLICALTGPSGGGKSSLLNVLSGVIQPTSGSITLAGEPINPKRHQIALVPQSYGLLPWKTAYENILLPETLGRRSVSRETRLEIIESLGLQDLLQRYPHELSGGQCQRVALARAFGMQPDLLLLDEPFSALDVVTCERSRQLFLDLWQRYPTTTLLVTHNPAEATALSSRALVIGGKPGRILCNLSDYEESELRQQLTKAYTYSGYEA